MPTDASEQNNTGPLGGTVKMSLTTEDSTCLMKQLQQQLYIKL